MAEDHGYGLSIDEKEMLIHLLHKVIRISVKVLAVLMVLVIMLGIIDVVWVVFQRLRQPHCFLVLKGKSDL